MSSRNNDVAEVLVTKGNQAVLGAGNKVTALAPGQIGVFNSETNTSINAAAAPATRNFYVAVGVDTDGDLVTDDIVKSAGSHVQKNNIKFYSYRSYTPGQAMVVLLSDYTADCETEYGIKLEFRNQEIYRSQGYNQFTKTYTMVTGCCDGCSPTCPSGDANEITKQLKLQMNNDPLGLITAIAVARQGILALTVVGLSGDLAIGDEVSDADLELVMAYNATLTDPADFLYTDLSITTVTQKVNSFCSVNLKYFYPRQTVIIASKIEGFKCNGKLATTQEAAFEEGAGYDIKQKEYHTIGYKQGHYRLSTLNGVAEERFFLTDSSAKYDQIHLTYDQLSLGGWLEYQNNLASTIAVPTADTTTRNGLLTILDALISPAGFDTLADDALASVTSTTTVEPTAQIDDETLDGIA